MKELKIKELTNEVSNLYLVIEFDKSKKQETIHIESIKNFEEEEAIITLQNKNKNLNDENLLNTFNDNKTLKKIQSKNVSPLKKKTMIIIPKNSDIGIGTKSIRDDKRRKTQFSEISRTLQRGSVVQFSETKKNSIQMKFENSNHSKKNDIVTLTNLDENNLGINNSTNQISEKNDSFENEKSNENSRNTIDSIDNFSKIHENKKEEKIFNFTISKKPLKNVTKKINIDNKIEIFSENYGKIPAEKEKYIRKNLEIISKYTEYRQLKRLNSMYLPSELNKENNLSLDKNNENTKKIEDLLNENTILLDCIKSKNAVKLFSNHIFPKNRTFQKEVEYILENFLINKKNSNYFNFLSRFLKTHRMPIQTLNKNIQTNAIALSTSKTQTDFLQNENFDSFSNKNEIVNLIKLVENIKKNGKDIEFNTTSTSIESKPEKNLDQIKKIVNQTQKNSKEEIRKITYPEKNVDSNKNIKLKQKKIDSIVRGDIKTNLDNVIIKRTESLHHSTKYIHENDETKENTQNISKFNSTAEIFNINTSKMEENNLYENNYEDKITKEVFDHMNKINKQKNDKNYSKFKFLFNYPFRSINGNFDQKKTFYEEIKSNDDEEEGKENFNFNKFQIFFKRMVNIHKKCGANCIHLRRFYEKIGFQIKIAPLKQELFIKKNILDKLPKIFKHE